MTHMKKQGKSETHGSQNKTRRRFHLQERKQGSRGSRCFFVHDSNAEAQQPGVHGSQSTTELCHEFQRTGQCSRGSRCRFVHGSYTQKADSHSTKGLCYEFQRTGQCSRGSKCRFVHGSYTQKPDSHSTTQFCNEFQRTGQCSRGSKCRFAHDSYPRAVQPEAHESSIVSEAPPSTPSEIQSTDVVSFMQSLERQVERGHVDLEEDIEMWLLSWTGCAVQPELLIRAWLLAAAKSKWAPTAMQQIEVLKAATLKARDVHVLTAVTDVIDERLVHGVVRKDRTWTMQDIVSAIENLKQVSSTRLIELLKSPKNMDIGGSVLSRLRKVCDKAIAATPRFYDDHVGNDDVQDWQGWKRPKLGWLLKGKFLDAPDLRSIYDSVEDYAETLERLLTLLTFYWAAGSVFPRCSVKKHDLPCAQPLCSLLLGSRSCRRKLKDGSTCKGDAIYSCFRHGHDAICADCLFRAQRGLIGPPSRFASTDLYDAVVDRETTRREGQVYILRDLKSRKPPTEAPNWRTSYRLKCSAFVALVRVSAKGDPLSIDTSLLWGEIVPVNQCAGAVADFAERKRGRIAVRLLSATDMRALDKQHHNEDSLDTGVRVVVMDCRVFVPEVISVLNTVSAADFVHNLHNVPFVERLLGQAAMTSNSGERAEEDPSCDDIQTVISAALAASEIDLVRRLSPTGLQALTRELEQLARKANLYGTQLQAFASALLSSLHCTQGPPGTGKSYLGVQLFLALDIIRCHATKSGAAVGPIVLLSYKNHALDEMLLDIVRADGRFDKTGVIIRCGNSEDPSLNKFKQRTTDAEVAAAKLVSSRLAMVRDARRSLRDFRELAREFRDAAAAAAIDGNRNHITCHHFDDWMPRRKDRNQSSRAAFVETVLSAVVFMLHIHQTEEAGRTTEDAFAQLEKLGTLDKRLINVCTEVTALSEDVDHWTRLEGFSRLAFLVDHWLRGRNPPPRCKAFREGGCMSTVDIPDTYCKQYHRCCYPSGCRMRRATMAGLVYCEDHRCQAVDHERSPCDKPRLPYSEGCKIHSCVYCLRSQIRPVRAAWQPMAHACEQHACQVTGCLGEYISPVLMACRSHACKVCWAVAAKRTTDWRIGSCIRVDNDSDVCADHQCTVAGCAKVRAKGGGCNALPQQQYCEDHACIRCSGVRDRVDSRCAQSRLCQNHRCSHASRTCRRPCASARLRDSIFCERHTCRACRDEGLALLLPCIEPAPRNFCKKHMLCRFQELDGTLCDEVARADSLYCSEHRITSQRPQASSTVEGQCEGMTRKKARCKTKVLMPIGSTVFYCGAHESQRPPHEEEGEDEEEEEDDEDEISSDDDSCDNASLSDISEAHDIESGAQGNIIENWAELLPEATEIESEEEVMGVAESKQEPPENQSEYSSNDETSRKEGSELGDDDEAVQAFELGAFEASGDELYLDDEDLGQGDDDQLRHLIDIGGEQSDASQASSNSPDNDDRSDGPLDKLEEAGDVQQSSSSSRSWSWEWTPSERWFSCSCFLQMSASTVARLIVEAEEGLDSARLEEAETAAHSFKRARLVGATIVGATRRLGAIRAAEPFAMIVEEACEVLEPTLIAVLSVRSLQKLEMIGDQRQLPAFVQQSWFALETTHCSIKTSLFERLVAVSTHAAAYTVLDEQSRMRPALADLTRHHYSDVVKIKDHACTTAQRIGDRVLKFDAKLKFERLLWEGNGLVMPGIVPQEFFWDIPNGREDRAHVGLSKANIVEAKLCAHLVQWLQHCGVPSAAIAVITPYKGQKLTITRELENIGAITKSRSWVRNQSGKTNCEVHSKQVFVTTIDRYQGDENDIVILSLVSSRPGNQFVALKNRFIVAASRARLGFVILGSVDAVKKSYNGGPGPPHWCRLLHDLTSNSSSGGQGEIPRISRRLTICCPRHRSICREIAVASDFPAATDNWCSQPCSYKLPWCGHQCQKTCHSSASEHTTDCGMPVPRQCQLHTDIPLRCSQVKHASSNSHDLQAALLTYRCEVKVRYQRPECSHFVEMNCSTKQDIENGISTLAPCSEKVDDYFHPKCNHCYRSPTCHNRRNWEKKPPLCKTRVQHKRSCGCTLSMTCFERTEELINEAQPFCLVEKTVPRPRCTHKLSLRCGEAVKLHDTYLTLDGQSVVADDGKVVVNYGISYGPSEQQLTSTVSLDINIPQCTVFVNYRASCGHLIKDVPCFKAFEYASNWRQEPRCETEEVFVSPICGHDVHAPCWLGRDRSRIPLAHIEAEGNDKLVRAATLREVLGADRSARKMCSNCDKSLTLIASCGHSSPVLCRDLPKFVAHPPPCNAPLQIDRDCGHVAEVACHRRGQPLERCLEPIDGVSFMYSCGRHSIRPKRCCDLQELRSIEDPACPEEVRCLLPRCSHEVTVPCCLEKRVLKILPGQRLDKTQLPRMILAGIDYSAAAPDGPACTEPVTFVTECGHTISNVPCHRAFDWAAEPSKAPTCMQEVPVSSPLCGHLISVPCRFVDPINEWDPWEGNPPESTTVSFEYEKEEPVTQLNVNIDERQPSRPDESLVSFLDCGCSADIVRECAHSYKIPCVQLLESPRTQRCEAIQSYVCPMCAFTQDVPCHQLRKQEFVPPCPNTVRKRCLICQTNTVLVECSNNSAECRAEVCAKLPCGHDISWECGKDDDPRQEQCLTCTLLKWTAALKCAEADAEELQMQNDVEYTNEENGEELQPLNDGERTNNVEDEGPQMRNTLRETNTPTPDACTSAEYQGVNVASSRRISAASLRDRLRGRMRALIPDNWVVKSETALALNISAIAGQLTMILRNYTERLIAAATNDEKEGLLLVSPPALDDVDRSYDLVFERVESADIDAAEVFIRTATRYGTGVDAKILNEQTLNNEAEQIRDGCIVLCVGAALKFRPILQTPPFMKRRKEVTANVKGKRKKKTAYDHACKRADQLRIQKLRAGFDHVVPTHGAESRRIYWLDAISPVSVVELQVLSPCDICMDMFPRSAGCKCQDCHFICWDCFTSHAEHARENGAIRRAAQDGNLRCPSCENTYSIQNIAGQANAVTDDRQKAAASKAVAAMVELKEVVRVNRAVQSALQEQEIRLKAEFDRIQKIQDAEERKVQQLRYDIIDKILTLRCPRCRVAFYDFSGCFALTCSNNTCGIQFCAWCCEHWDHDVHAHVANCPKALLRGYFHSLETFDQHQRRRRELLIRDRLNREDEKTRARVLIALQKELDDLKIRIEPNMD